MDDSEIGDDLISIEDEIGTNTYFPSILTPCYYRWHGVRLGSWPFNHTDRISNPNLHIDFKTWKIYSTFFRTQVVNELKKEKWLYST